MNKNYDNDIVIKLATPRDMSHIGMNLNAADKAEAQGLVDLPLELVAAAHTGDWCYTAWYKGEPVCGFGISPMMASCWSAWLFGTKDSRRVIPQVTKFFNSMIETMEEIGVGRLEARSLEGHTIAQRWLTNNMGFTKACDLPNFGLNGQTYQLYERVI